MKRNIPTPAKMQSMLEDYFRAYPEHAKSILPQAMRLNPSVVIEKNGRPISVDPVSYMLQNRVIFYTGAVDEVTAELATTQLLFLEAENPEKEIHMNIASPGGIVYYGMGVIDTMNTIQPDVVTIGHGLQMSMGAMTLIHGAPGKRYVLPNSRVMIHQPSGGSQGTASSMAESQNEIDYLKAKLLYDIETLAGITFEEALYYCEKNYYMSARTALTLGTHGIVDGIIIDKGFETTDDDGKVNKITLIARRQDTDLLDKYCPDLSSYVERIKRFNNDEKYEREMTNLADKAIAKNTKK